VTPPPPTDLSYSTPQVYARGQAINPLTPTVTNSVDAYSVSPALPAGLIIDAENGQISGTPTAAAGTTLYTITATNEGGSAKFDLAITVRAVDVISGSISRTAVNDTTLDVAVVIRPVNFTFANPLYSAAEEPLGIFQNNPAVLANSDGTYTLTLTTSNSAGVRRYVDSVTLALCATSNCSERQAIPAVSVPFDIKVMSLDSEWPGNNLSSLEPWPDVNEWSMFQGNAAHTGYVPVELNPDVFSTRWKRPESMLSVSSLGSVANLAVEDGRLFVSGADQVRALREDDASEIWTQDFSYLQYPSSNPPAVADGVVYVAAGQQSATGMFAFDAKDGSPVFSSPMSSQWENYLAPTIGQHGVYTNAGTYGGMYAFDRAGEQLFPMTYLPQTSLWTPAVDATGVYTYTGKLEVFEPVTGAKIAEVADPTFQNYIYMIGGSPVLGAPGSVFAANYANSILNGGGIGNTLTRFNVTSESIAWSVSGVYPTTPAYHDGVLYAVNENPRRLEARAEADGQLLWWWTPPLAGSFEGEVMLTSNLVFVSMNTGTFAIDVRTHRTVWSYPMAGHLAMSKSGILYIQGSDSIVAINVK
jgi:hypothetical protein